jgi:hypothetical protein
MKPTKTCTKPVHPADARRIPFRSVPADVAPAALKVKPGPMGPKAKTSKHKNASKIALIVLAITALLSSFPIPLRGDPSLGEHDLHTQVTAFGNYMKDFQEMEKSLSGEEFDEANFLEETASLVDERIYATAAMLQMYDAVSCKNDRANVKPLLKEQLNESSWRLNEQTTRTTGFLPIVKVPALATEGIKMRDDMRAAKEKVDSISASLPN